MNTSTRHIVDRIIKDVEFLESQGHLGTNSVTTIRDQLTPLLLANADGDAAWETIEAASASSQKLPTVATADKSTPSQTQTPAAAHQPKQTLGTRLPWTKKVPPSAPAPAASPAPSKEAHLVKALWAFEASGGDDELKFAIGDVIQVVEKNDDNWWTGAFNGRRGLFPANYVEPYTATEPVSPTPQRNLPPAYNTAVASSVDRVYAPVKARWTSGSSVPTSPPAEKAASAVAVPPSSTAAGPSAHQAAESEEEKKKQDKIKKLGGKVGTAAAGGFGFGIGAGLASNLF